MLTQVKPHRDEAQLDHCDVASFYVRFKRAEWGGLEPDTLVVVTRLPLERGAAGYDEDKVMALEKAVSKYVKARHSPYAHIEFIQKSD